MFFDDTRSRTVQAEEEENYFVSMTDMMVGVLFVFIIMLMVFALDFREKTDEQLQRNDRLQEETERIAEKLDALQKRVKTEIAFLAEQQDVRNSLLRDIRKALEDEGLLVEIDETNGVLRLTEDAVRFGTNRSDLVGQARVNVLKMASALAAVLPRYAKCSPTNKVKGCGGPGKTTVETVFIEGHTDATGLVSHNWQLSTERAVSTYREIDAAQPQLALLTNRAGRQIMSVSGYAATRPVTQDTTTAGYARNRRIDLRFVMETDQQGRLDEILNLTSEMADQIQALRQVVDESSNGQP